MPWWHTFQLRHDIKDDAVLKRIDYANLLSEADKVYDYLRRVPFADRTSLYITGRINRHNSASRVAHWQLRIQLAHVVHRLQWSRFYCIRIQEIVLGKALETGCVLARCRALRRWYACYQRLAVRHHIDIDDGDRAGLRNVNFVPAVTWLITWRRVNEFVCRGNCLILGLLGSSFPAGCIALDMRICMSDFVRSVRVLFDYLNAKVNLCYM